VFGEKKDYEKFAELYAAADHHLLKG